MTRKPKVGEKWITNFKPYKIIAVGPEFVTIFTEPYHNMLYSTLTMAEFLKSFAPPKKMVKVRVNLYRYESGNQAANAFLSKMEADRCAIGKYFNRGQDVSYFTVKQVIGMLKMPDHGPRHKKTNQEIPYPGVSNCKVKFLIDYGSDELSILSVYFSKDLKTIYVDLGK